MELLFLSAADGDAVIKRLIVARWELTASRCRAVIIILVRLQVLGSSEDAGEQWGSIPVVLLGPNPGDTRPSSDSLLKLLWGSQNMKPKPSSGRKRGIEREAKGKDKRLNGVGLTL
ncbi:hypothetical protein MHYP_G00034360 [Metynnis hypsauchen]